MIVQNTEEIGYRKIINIHLQFWVQYLAMSPQVRLQSNWGESRENPPFKVYLKAIVCGLGLAAEKRSSSEQRKMIKWFSRLAGLLLFAASCWGGIKVIVVMGWCEIYINASIVCINIYFYMGP